MQDFRKGGGGSELLLTTKTTKLWCIHAHMLNIFSLFLNFGGPPKERGAPS